MKRFLSLVILAACASQPAQEVASHSGPFSIMQGMSDEHSIQLNLVIPRKAVFEYRLMPLVGGGLIEARSRNVIEFGDSAWSVAKLRYEGLESGKYLFEVREAGQILDSRELSTLDLGAPSIRIGLMSCADDSYEKEQAGMWHDLHEQNPDILIFMGDNVYADKPPLKDASSIYKRYFETRRRLQIYKEKRLIPIVATWDDHDYAQNDGDRGFKYREQSREDFEAFFSQDSTPALERGPGVSSRLSAFGMEFYLMDDRYFRSPPGPGTHWGDEQEKWLLKHLSDGQGPAMLINGDQFFGGYHHFESYEGTHTQSFEAMLPRLKKTKRLILFVSGDRHLAELMRIPPKVLGYETYELTTSAIHATVHPPEWDKHPNPRQIEGVGMKFNYAIVDSKVDSPFRWKLDVTAYGPAREKLFARKLYIGKWKARE